MDFLAGISIGVKLRSLESGIGYTPRGSGGLSK